MAPGSRAEAIQDARDWLKGEVVGLDRWDVVNSLLDEIDDCHRLFDKLLDRDNSMDYLGSWEDDIRAARG